MNVSILILLFVYFIGNPKQFEVLVAAIATDSMAGSPLAEYILEQENYAANSNLKFLNFSNFLLSGLRPSDTALRKKQTQAIVNLFLSENSPRMISLPEEDISALREFLHCDVGITRLMEACKKIAEVSIFTKKPLLVISLILT